jgi:metal-dependent amidase/aminoacylase/carboxypeptidase family protein
MAAVYMMNITIYGKGGQGAAPQHTIDPVVLSAQILKPYLLQSGLWHCFQ